jgi:pyoverdine/dityrosine biosynthesis protein Dit1
MNAERGDGWCLQDVTNFQDDPEQRTAKAILTQVLRHERPLHPTNGDVDWTQPVLATALNQVVGAIRRQEPVDFVLPSFPAKSPNRKKTLGPLPDMAEWVALDFIGQLCRDVRSIYAPGTRLVIASDGRVVCDLVGVSDDHVSEYRRELERHLAARHHTDVQVVSLEDLFAGSYDEARRDLAENFGPTEEDLRNEARENPDVRRYVNGIERFLFEDFRVLHPDAPTTPIRKECHRLVYRLMRRTRAWSRVLSERYPKAVRLSVHPQPRNGSKLGIHLISTHDAWRTPWHGCAVDRGSGRFELMRRDDAEKLGCNLVWAGSRPSHYLYAG